MGNADNNPSRQAELEQLADVSLPEVPLPEVSVTEDDLEGAINASLADVLDLLGRQVEQLSESLAYYRATDHPARDQITRWHVQEIDLRHDRMDEIKALIFAQDPPDVH